MLSIIIPTHNEAQRIGETISRLGNFLNSAEGKKTRCEIILVDDSSDGTVGVARKAARQAGISPRARFITFPKRMGKGAAVTAGFNAAKGDCLLYDADGSTPPEEIPKALRALAGADLVIGSRRLPESGIRNPQPRERRAASRAFNLLVRMLFPKVRFKDTQCGFKLVSRRAWREIGPRMESAGFAWDVELLARAAEAGITIQEIPIEWAHKPKGVFSALPLRSAVRMFSELVRIRL